ncbi:MAG: electron transfer flavoprotein subunit beta/FixA family protein [Elusimicrobiota bacterium]
MPIKLIVCIKRTPASTSVAIGSDGTVQTAGVAHAINAFDEYAIEEALRVKEKLAGSTVTALSAGSEDAVDILRGALAVGCDEAVLLSDPAFDGSDTYGTSHILAKAIEKIAGEGPAIVVFGKQTNDGESGHITASVGAWLKWPSAISIRKIAEVSESALSVERVMEDGIDTMKLQLPAVIGVTKEINEPRLPSLKGKMGAKKKQIQKWGAGDINTDAAVIGKGNSPSVVVGQAPVPARPSGAAIPGETPVELAKNLVEKLKEAKFI